MSNKNIQFCMLYIQIYVLTYDNIGLMYKISLFHLKLPLYGEPYHPNKLFRKCFSLKHK